MCVLELVLSPMVFTVRVLNRNSTVQHNFNITQILERTKKLTHEKKYPNYIVTLSEKKPLSLFRVIVYTKEKR